MRIDNSFSRKNERNVIVTLMSDSIRYKRSSLEESSPQYERTGRGKSLVCRLSRQWQRRVATFLTDNC